MTISRNNEHIDLFLDRHLPYDLGFTIAELMRPKRGRYMCEHAALGCGFSGGFFDVEAHERVCKYDPKGGSYMQRRYQKAMQKQEANASSPLHEAHSR